MSENKKVEHLSPKHRIGYGAGDAGGVVTLSII